METNSNFFDFITAFDFEIPDYQRAYSWGEKQLLPFIKDILEHTNGKETYSVNTKYYLGHFILEKSFEHSKYEIVDGQQRISTVYLFLLVCGYLKKKEYIEKIRFKPVVYDIEGFEKIKTILNIENSNENELTNLLIESKTSSLKRMIEAVIFFIKAFSDTEKIKTEKLLKFDDIEKYIDIINNAHCSVAVFTDKSVASQIFELHNTRGVKLTETEKVKALLMKNIYINSTTQTETNINIKKIQESFAQIFELEERANEVWLRGEMTLDLILMYHLRAVEDGQKNENFNSPQAAEGDFGSFEYIKKSLYGKSRKEIVDYAINLAIEFAKTMEIITFYIPNADKQDNNHLIGDILLLDKTKSLIFLLRAFRANSSIDHKLVERWENFILCYEIILWNGFFHGKQHRGNFHEIFSSLKPNQGHEECKNLLKEYYEGRWFGSDWKHLGENSIKLFEEGKSKWISNTYGWYKAGYFLYKHEIQNNANIEKIRADIFKDNVVSIDHIVARGLSWYNLGYPNYNDLSEDDKIKIEADKLWKEISSVINGIGNLALSTISNNASDSNKLPSEHIKTYQKNGLGETVKLVKTWESPKEFVEKINYRSEIIIKFISEKILNRPDIWQ